MSWSVSSCGRVTDVHFQVREQFDKINLSDQGEQKTVEKVKEMILHTLETFGADLVVKVSASGHMGYRDWTTKVNPFQQVDVKIEPVLFTIGS